VTATMDKDFLAHVYYTALRIKDTGIGHKKLKQIPPHIAFNINPKVELTKDISNANKSRGGFSERKKIRVCKIEKCVTVNSDAPMRNPKDNRGYSRERGYKGRRCFIYSGSDPLGLSHFQK
jgi:hypothetical protein